MRRQVKSRKWLLLGNKPLSKVNGKKETQVSKRKEFLRGKKSFLIENEAKES